MIQDVILTLNYKQAIEYFRDKIIDDIKFSHMRVSPRKKKRPKDYADICMTFDIETTKVRNESKNGKPWFNYCYLWQSCINGVLVYGRYVYEFFVMQSAINEMLKKLGEDKRMICYTHNLSYEYGNCAEYFCQNCEDLEHDIFFKTTTHPLYIVNGAIEHRCSYLLTHKSLAKLSKEVGLEKSAELDYSVQRHSNTPIKDYELDYGLRDVYNLWVWCETECRKRTKEIGSKKIVGNKTLSAYCTMPYTQTGYVRYDIQNGFSNTKAGNKMLNFMALGQDLFLKCNRAFRGGDTQVNAKYVGMVFEDVRHRDLTSAYPAVLIMRKYPCSEWYKVHTNSVKVLNMHKKKGRHTLARYVLHGVSLKKHRVGYISFSKSEKVSEDNITVNGRVMFADMIEAYWNEIDFEIIEKTYNIESIEVKEAYYAYSDYLPADLVKVFLKYFENKTKLKGAKTLEELEEYMRSKERLNGAYGCSATSLIHSIIRVNEDDYITVDTHEKKFTESKTIPYQIALYCTSYVRQIINNFKFALGDDFIYCDTDSIFYKINEKFEKVVDKYNKECYNILVKVAKRIEYPLDKVIPKSPKGIECVLGTFLADDDYIVDKFVSVGAKRYCLTTNGKTDLVVSGIRGTKTDDNGNIGEVTKYLADKYGKGDIYKAMQYLLKGNWEIPYNATSYGKLSHSSVRGNFYGVINDGQTIQKVTAKSSLVLLETDLVFALEPSIANFLFGRCSKTSTGGGVL